MSLKKSFGKSTLWMSAAASGNSVISFVIFIILSRLLAPEDIGLVAFALIVVELGKILVNAGLPQAIVRHPEWDEHYAATCFYLNLLLAALVTAMVFFIAAPVIAYYYDTRAELLVQVLCIIFLLEGVKAVHEGKLKREFNFRAIAFRTVISSLLAGCLGVFLAFQGYGVWALVAQQLLSHALITLLTIINARWMPDWHFSFVYARAQLGFSTPLALAQMIGNLANAVYDILIGVILGSAALGFFRVGGRALFILQEIVIKPFEQTLMPALARLNARDAQAEATLRVIRVSAYFTFPIFFGAAALGPEFIELAFTAKWAQSGQIMTFLALGIAPMVIGYQVNAALATSGHSKRVMQVTSINFVLNCILGVLLVPYGVVIAAAGFALRSYLGIFFNMWFFKHAFGVSVGRQLGTVAPTFFAALMMFAVVLCIKYLVLPGDMHLGVRVLLLAGVGCVSYTLIMSCIFRQETKHFLGESAAMAPAKAKPLIDKLQRLLRLA
ncbi:lipopolysaccharide biosynthesis protein [Cellvibrio sp. pealriver]|uniref:lipopolysaccharide biosynthesis protein n=1 Tax=Cellvibrio sp. pealriver TaxID=1622269 RepID=UPI00066FE51F|nr:lipopolysaccharide biosynthesis protein [Cellvibrio sp. pealriver]